MLSTKEGPADWINHSCEPNAGLSGQIVLVAMRDIMEGEEITFDYAMAHSSLNDDFDCECGSSTCRGHVKSSDWAMPELQKKYKGYFSPYIQQLINIQQNTKTIPQNLKRRINGLETASSG